MSPRYSLIIFITLLFFSSHTVQAASAFALTAPQYGHELWQTEQGLPQNTVQAILQTRDGYIWVGTKEGLARFDGLRFTTFDKQNTPQMLHNQVRSLYEDREGRLWIATPGGLLLYQGGAFTGFTTKDGLASNNIWSVCQDQAGSLWIATVNGLNRYHESKFTTYTTREGLSHNSIGAVLADQGGALWIGTEEGLNHFQDGVFTAYTKKDGLAGNAIKTLFKDQQGRLWIGTADGLSLFANGKFAPLPRTGLLPNTIGAIAEDQAGTLWIGSARGLTLYRDEKFEAASTAEGFTEAAILALHKDREGNLWIGTEANGLHLLKTKKFTTYTTREGLSANVVRSIYGDRSGKIWIGTQERGLNLWSNGQISPFAAQQSLRGDDVMALCDDAEGNLWVGTTAGLRRIRAGHTTTFTVREGLSDNHVRSLYASRDGSLWIGTRRGLTQFRSGAFTPYTMLDGLPSDLVGAICEDRQGNLWIGTLGGLSCFKDGKFTNYTMAAGLSSEVVIALYEDSDGKLWIGTHGGGLNYLKDGRFSYFTTKDGLSDDVIYQILEDEQKHLWMSSNKGIMRVNRQELETRMNPHQKLQSVVTFGTADGMETRECSGGGHPAGWKTADGKLWFATIKGVAMIDPAHLKLNEQTPPIAIEQVVIDDKVLAMNGPIKLSPETARLEFYYTGLSFVAPQKVTFKYKLEGFDKDWIEAGTRRVAWYTNIPAGRYRFLVLACNNDGVWSETAASVEFLLQPHFYQTWWFYSVCLLSLGLGIGVWYRLRVKRIKGRLQGQFDAILTERTRIAREIHDTLAQGFAGISVQLELVARMLTIAPQSAQPHLDQARQLVRSSLDEARRSVWDLRSQALESSDLPSALSETVKRLVADTSLQAQVQVKGTYRELSRTIEDHLLRIGQEAITNAIKHAGAQHLQVELSYVTKSVKLRVQDDGCGFDSRQGSPNGHFGLVGMRERVAQMGGKLIVQSQPQTGTEITVEVPLS